MAIKWRGSRGNYQAVEGKAPSPRLYLYIVKKGDIYNVLVSKFDDENQLVMKQGTRKSLSAAKRYAEAQ